MSHARQFFPPTGNPSRILFVCRSNAAWSLIAEAILNRVGGERFHAFSAGLDPAPKVDPLTLDQLAKSGLPVAPCFTKPFQGFRDDSLIPESVSQSLLVALQD